MNELINAASKLWWVFLAFWLLSEGLGKERKPDRSAERERAQVKGTVWATAVAQAPSSEDQLAFPMAPII